MARVQADAHREQAAADLAPRARVVLRDRALAREVEVDLLVGPARAQVGRGVHRSRSAADHDHRTGGCDRVVVRPEVGVDLLAGLQPGPTPEAVGHPCRDDQGVVRLDGAAAGRQLDGDLPGVEIQTAQRSVQAAYAVEPAVATEVDPVVTGPVVGSRQAHAELLPADELGLGRDADDLDVPGEVDRGEGPDVAEAGDDDPRPAAAHRGGRGR